MTPIERLGTGLGVMGIGVALFVGLPPPWWPDMPPLMVHIGVGIGILLNIVGVCLVLNSVWVGRKMWPVIGMAVCGVGFVACAAWYFWPVPVSSPANSSSTAAPLVSSAPPHSAAYFDCGPGWWPEAEQAPRGALIISVMQFSNAEPTIGAGPGPAIKENHNKQYSSTAPIKCEVTFYGTSPIFNVEMQILVDLYEVIIRTDHSNASGNLVKTLTAKIGVTQISVPGRNVFTFYVYSFDANFYIGVRAPDIFTYVTDEGGIRYEGKSIRSESALSSMLIGPNPPVPSTSGPNISSEPK
jgi:hypothetical protein